MLDPGREELPASAGGARLDLVPSSSAASRLRLPPPSDDEIGIAMLSESFLTFAKVWSFITIRTLASLVEGSFRGAVGRKLSRSSNSGKINPITTF
jgi:hypothetical protein